MRVTNITGITGSSIKSLTARSNQYSLVNFTLSHFSTSSLANITRKRLRSSLHPFRMNFDSSNIPQLSARDGGTSDDDLPREPCPRASSWNSKSKVPPCRVHRTDGRKETNFFFSSFSFNTSTWHELRVSIILGVPYTLAVSSTRRVPTSSRKLTKRTLHAP